jgi:hypothetical protein
MLQRWLFHIACVLALTAPAFINGQPFYFPDSTAYTRAADSAAYVFSGHRINTEWTDRYRNALEKGGKIGGERAKQHVSAAVNDLSVGAIMAGRSPYFGALLWLSYVLSHFWLFVIAQAAIAYGLIRLTLRLFGFARPKIVAGTVAALMLLTSLPFFASLLMPDLLAGFGILAFLLLAIDRGRLGNGERWALYALILVSVISHITHVLIIAVMALLLFVWAKIRRWPDARYKRLIGGSSLLVLVGTVSVMLTSVVVERTFGARPLLVPLLTARFLADGTGLAYIKQNCPESGFAACAYRDRSKVIVGLFLWSLKPGEGAYMIASAEHRRALSIEDKRFAWAVIRAYPAEQGGRILYNGARQMLRFDIDLLNYHCMGKPHCWASLPPRERVTLLASPAGRDLWPQRAFGVIHYTAVAVALVVLLAWSSSQARRRGEGGEDILLWFTLLIVAFWVNALLGGGVSDPQPRYQARVIWLLPLLAMLTGLVWRRGMVRLGG